MPRPNPGESKEAYVSRFMASAEAQKDFPDEKQRAAVAYSMWGEKKNGLCSSCGAMTERRAAAHDSQLVNEVCVECGREEHYGPDSATPPIESLRNLCPVCRHQLESGHSEFGCAECPCTASFEVIVEPRDVLPNATDEGAWKKLSEPERKAAAVKAGVNESYGYVVRWSAIPQDVRDKLGLVLTGLPNAQPKDGDWKNPADYAEGYCKTCDYQTPGFHKQDCAILKKERAAYEKAQNKNSTPICSACLSACPNPTEADAEEVGGKIHLKRTKDDGSGHWEAYCGANCCENRNRKETHEEALARRKVEAQQWWDGAQKEDRNLALKRAGFPIDTHDIKDGWAQLPAASRKAIVEAMDDKYRHEIGNTDTCQACVAGSPFRAYQGHEKACAQCRSASSMTALCAEGAQLYEAVESDHASHENRNAACKHPGDQVTWSGNWMSQGVDKPMAMRGTCSCGAMVSKEHDDPHQNATPRSDQTDMIAARLRDILGAHGSAMVYKHGSNAPAYIKSVDEAGDLAKVSAVEVPQGLGNATREEYKAHEKKMQAAWDAMKPLTAEMNRLEDKYNLPHTPRGQTPKGPPDYVQVMEKLGQLEKEYDHLLATRPTSIDNADDKGPFNQPNKLGCNYCDDIRAPLNKDGYCKDCAAEQGPRLNASDEQCEFCGAREGLTGFKALQLCPKCLAEYKARREKAGLSNGLTFPASHFKRPEAKERADREGIAEMEDEDLTPEGLKAKAAARAEAHENVAPVMLGDREAAGTEAYGSRK